MFFKWKHPSKTICYFCFCTGLGALKPFSSQHAEHSCRFMLFRPLNASLYVKTLNVCCPVSTESRPDVQAQMHWRMFYQQTSRAAHSKVFPSHTSSKICANVYASLFASHNSYCDGKTMQYCQSVRACVCVIPDTIPSSNIYSNLCWGKPAVVLPYLTALLVAFESLKQELLCPRGLGNFPCSLAWGIIE